MDRQSRIIAIVGPKGGVGKTTISANLAIALANLDRKVVAVDLDLGASNLHTMFGLRSPAHTLADFVLAKVKHLSDIIVECNIKNLGIICGGDIPGIANLHYAKKMKLIRHLSSLEKDIILLDLSAGTSNNVIDFILIAKEALLITTPEIPSLMNVYSLIKTLIFRRLAIYFNHIKDNRLTELLEKAKDFESYPHLKTMTGLIQEASRINPGETEMIRKILSGFKPVIVINRVRSERDKNAGNVISNLMSQFLNINSGQIFIIHEDTAVESALMKLKPVMIESPASVFARDIQRMAQIIDM